VVLAEGNTSLKRLPEAERHDLVAKDDGLLLTAIAVDDVDHVRDFLLGHQFVHDIEGNLEMVRQQLPKNHTAGRGVENLRYTLALAVEGRRPPLDPGVQGDRLGMQSMFDLAHIAECHPLARFALAHQRNIIETEHDILRWHDDWLAISRMQYIVGRHHQHARFELRLERERHVHRHLVAIEIGIERGANKRMQLDGLTLDQFRFEGLNAETVQRRRPVQHDRMLANDFVENIPDFRFLFFDQLFRLFDGRRKALRVETRIDEGLEEFERHLLRQAALVQFEVRPNHDDRAAGIIDALAKQVLAKTALFALQHVGERLQRPLVGAGDDPAAPAIVEQSIDGLLQHPLLVAHDDVWRAQFDESFQAIVTVDDAPVKVVEVGGREAAAVERHKRPQVGRKNRNFGKEHPLGLVPRTDEGLINLRPLVW